MDVSRCGRNEVDLLFVVLLIFFYDFLVVGLGVIILYLGLGIGENVFGMVLVFMWNKIFCVLDNGKCRVWCLFSVIEVEVLVYVVEKLGIGR